jgi:CheY-like chemotaxis protein
MNNETLLGMFKNIVNGLKTHDPELYEEIREDSAPEMTLEECGIDETVLPIILYEMKSRLNNRDFSLDEKLQPEYVNTATVGALIDDIRNDLTDTIKDPIVVYVDDEEENLYIFKRKFGKTFTLKTFSDPTEALAYIAKEPSVRLVITDEVMPGLRGNELCDNVHQIRPFMKFILITGNPEGDNNLMYRSLRANRFYDFIQKPVDFDSKREQYIEMIQSLINSY